MYKMLFISVCIKPFKSTWGAWLSCQSHEDGFICPLGWENELNSREIDFETIEIEYDEPDFP
jgi:hypothetical protein